MVEWVTRVESMSRLAERGAGELSSVKRAPRSGGVVDARLLVFCPNHGDGKGYFIVLTRYEGAGWGWEYQQRGDTHHRALGKPVFLFGDEGELRARKNSQPLAVVRGVGGSFRDPKRPFEGAALDFLPGVDEPGPEELVVEEGESSGRMRLKCPECPGGAVVTMVLDGAHGWESMLDKFVAAEQRDVSLSVLVAASSRLHKLM